MFNEKRVIQGWCDAPLTSEGEEQAERIGRYFAREGIAFDHAYTSTLTRTQQTIERIVDMPYERVEGLREWGFGVFEGERVQTMFNEKRVIQGWCDAPLTSEGEEQAERIGRYFAREGIAFDHAYTSTLTRTQQTIERIVDMPYERVEGLREWGFGVFEGERVDLMPPFPWGNFYVPFGGEGQMAVRTRVSDALARIMEQPGHERVLVVSHGSACREFLTKWVPDGGFGRPRERCPGTDYGATWA